MKLGHEINDTDSYDRGLGIPDVIGHWAEGLDTYGQVSYALRVHTYDWTISGWLTDADTYI